MDTENKENISQKKDVVIIGNGPSAIALSFILSGHIPYWNGCPVSNDYLNIKLEQHVKDKSLLEQDFEFLSDGLEGRSGNPVSLLIDNLTHPDADLGANLQSKLKWRYEPSLSIDHLCFGRHGIGGVWSQSTSKDLRTISIANWLELPNYSMETFRHKYREHLCEPPIANDKRAQRATYDEIHAYFINYVKKNRLKTYFRNYCEITSIERNSIGDLPWKIFGYDIQDNSSFSLYAKYVVLATGIPQNITRPLGIPNEHESQSITYTNLNQIQQLLINENRLTKQSKPLLVIGCGLAAIDVLLLCQLKSIPVIHIFRRSIDDNDLLINKLSLNIYPEYDYIKELIRQTKIPKSSQWSYQYCSQSEVISIKENGIVHVRHLRMQTVKEFQISFVARLTGVDIHFPFFSSLVTKHKSHVNINPYTYECMELNNIYALGALAGDKLVRFLQGGAFACAADLFKKHSKNSSSKIEKYSNE